MKSPKIRHVLSEMPALSHYPRKPEEFDILDSEVVQWMAKNRAIMLWLFDAARQSKTIVFDAQSECWRGVGITKNQHKKDNE